MVLLRSNRVINHSNWWRSNRMMFNRKVEHRSSPLELFGLDIITQLMDVSKNRFGKEARARKKQQAV